MKLFWRIFLSFWIGTVLMIAAVLVADEFWPTTFPGDRKVLFKPDVAKSTLIKAINTYELQGPSAFLQEVHAPSGIGPSSLYLLDHQGTLLAKEGSPPPFWSQLAGDALQNGASEAMRLGLQMEFAFPIVSATGKRYVVVMTTRDLRPRILRPRFWFNLSVATLPCALVCLALSLYITRPISRLRATARRLAGGDLTARSWPHRVARRDELGDLSRDFDQMADQIEQLMTAQRRFVSDVSHELGAPLTRMHLALALLRREYSSQSSAGLERIERETDKLSNLVQQLLLLAGLEAGRCPGETLAAVSLQSLCESLIEDASFEADHSRCRILASLERVTLFAYPRLLRRAIDNVLRNAIRYTAAGSEIQLHCRTEGDQQNAVIEILDCGPGVPESMLADIFLPFFRTAPGRESDSGGTGLGLAIAAEAVRLHGGHISARNRVSGGLHVTITLPVRSSADVRDFEISAAGMGVEAI